jgi:hypothetical protein
MQAPAVILPQLLVVRVLRELQQQRQQQLALGWEPAAVQQAHRAGRRLQQAAAAFCL